MEITVRFWGEYESKHFTVIAYLGLKSGDEISVSEIFFLFGLFPCAVVSAVVLLMRTSGYRHAACCSIWAHVSKLELFFA